MVNSLIEKKEKPEVTTNSKTDVKKVKSVDTNIPAIEHPFNNKNQRPRSQVLDDGEHGDEPEEPDNYDAPTVRSDHYEAHTGEADHYKATLETSDQTNESTGVFDDEDEKVALVIALQ